MGRSLRALLLLIACMSPATADDARPTLPATLVASAVGFSNDTLAVSGPAATITFELEAVTLLKEAEVVERQAGTRLNTRTLQATENIGAKELKRAACCDLSESFESNATVVVSYSDAVSGAKTIRMLGLDGKYAQISVENIQKTVADYYKIKVADMYSKKRPASIARPRQIAMYLAKELTQKSLPEIGELFGGRDHTTVLHAVRKIASERQQLSELNQQLHVLEQTLKG